MGAWRRKPERGAAAVEFALVLPLLMVILLGTIDWGYFFFVEQLVTNASREGARTGSLTPSPGGEGTAEADAKKAATDYLIAAGLDGDVVSIDPEASSSSIKVTVSYPTGSITGFKTIEALLPKSATATAEMRR